MVEGIPSRVAFEATDAYGNPIALSGTVINREKKEIASFATVHEGRGTFVYTPTNGENHKAEVELNGKSTVLICRKPGCRDMPCRLIIFLRKTV